MPHPQLNRNDLRFYPLEERTDRVFIERDHVDPGQEPGPFAPADQAVIDEAVTRIREARAIDAPRMLAFGAHTIKNGLAPVLIKLIEDGWITHLATNGAGIIHDWEFAYQGHTSEHVADNVKQGRFGMWEETCRYLNLAIVVGAYEGLGYGESVGALVEDEGLDIPSMDELIEEARSCIDTNPERAAAAADLMTRIRDFGLSAGRMPIQHPYKTFGLQAAAYRLGVPFTGHPMIGHDIIYNHPMNHGAAIGRTAQRDFLAFADGVTNLNNGIYMSIGSAVMSPMIFEKSMSMGQNLAIQRSDQIDNHLMVIVDLQKSSWDWMQGEPPEDHPDYYLRFNKSFSRMGGVMRYLCAHNRDFLLGLIQGLRKV